MSQITKQLEVRPCRLHLCGSVTLLLVQVRFLLTQAVDAQRYSPTTADAVQQSCMARCRLLEAALASPRGRQLGVGETASLMWLLLQGHLDAVGPSRLWVRPHRPLHPGNVEYMLGVYSFCTSLEPENCHNFFQNRLATVCGASCAFRSLIYLCNASKGEHEGCCVHLCAGVVMCRDLGM